MACGEQSSGSRTTRIGAIADWDGHRHFSVNNKNSHQRVAVTGASGLLGRVLVRELLAQGHDVIAAIHESDAAIPESVTGLRLDLLSRESIQHFVQDARADVIIHSAAWTDVDGCEREHDKAEALNATATEHLMDAVGDSSCRVVYISTDYVYDGRSGPKGEDDPPAPINIYGLTKLQGEKAVRKAGPQHAIVRSSSFLGVGQGDRLTFVEAMLRRMKTDPPLKAPTDQRSNITPVDYLAQGIVEIATHAYEGVWHLVLNEILSRYDFARRLAKLFDLENELVVPVAFAELDRVAPRPLDGGLLSNRELTTPNVSLSDALIAWKAELERRRKS